MTRYFKFTPQIEPLESGSAGIVFTPLMGEVSPDRIYPTYEESTAHVLSNHADWKESTEQEYDNQPPVSIPVGKWDHLPQSLRPIVEHEDIIYGTSPSIGLDVVLGTPPVVTFDPISPDIPEGVEPSYSQDDAEFNKE